MVAPGQRRRRFPFHDATGILYRRITRPDGSMRVIFFQVDKAAFSAEQQDGVSFVRVGEERYEIFEAVVFGG